MGSVEKKYSERQYATYLQFMDRIANEVNMVKGYQIHLEFKSWLEQQGLNDEAVKQMDERLEKENMTDSNSDSFL